MYTRILNPDMDEVAANLVRQQTNRAEKESAFIDKIDNVQDLILILDSNPDTLNLKQLVNKFLKYKETGIPLIFNKLKTHKNDEFVEAAIEILYSAKDDYSQEILELLQYYQRDAYIVSSLCLLLGFYDDARIEKVLWDYYHFLKEHFPNESYSDGPLLALMEKRIRKEEEKEVFPKKTISNAEPVFHSCIDGIRQYTTKQIILSLQNLGFHFDKTQFLQDVKRFDSACNLADYWFENYPIYARGHDEDFVWMACIVLWERFAPDVMNIERIDEMMQKGYAYMEARLSKETCDFWLQVWEYLKKRLPTNVKSIEEFDKLFPQITQSIFNWCQDLETELYNAGREDPSYYKKAIKYYREFYTLLPNSSELNIHSVRRLEAECHFALGKTDQGEKLFEFLIKDYPDNVWGYIGWGDMYAPGIKYAKAPKDPAKAEQIYKMALGKNLEDEEDVLERLKDLIEDFT